jgi:hypothetical protein
MEGNLLDGVGDVGAGECQVLEGYNDAPELSRISSMRPESSRDLALCIRMGRDRLAVDHASALKDVKSELSLSEKESICLMLYEDPPKMVKWDEVLHVEFPLEVGYGVLQEHYTRCGEHNVINIKQQVYHISVVVEDTQEGVRLHLNKTQSEEVRGEPDVPTSGLLFQPIERLVKAIDPVRLRGINKPCRLTTVDYL